MGPTASGKTQLAELLADSISGQLINADAFHVYRGLDVGTNKPVHKNRYRMIDLVDPREGFGVGEWVRCTLRELESLHSQKKNAIVVGGTGLYCRALFEEWSDLCDAPDAELRRQLSKDLARDGLATQFARLTKLAPDSSSKIDPNNPRRVMRALEKALGGASAIPVELPDFRRIKFGVQVGPQVLMQRIKDRATEMLSGGWIEEVKNLVQNGVSRNDPGMRAIGYRSVLDLVEGRKSKTEALDAITLHTRQYAKRQRTWLRSEPNLYTLDAERGPEEGLAFMLRQIGSSQGVQGS